MKEIEKKIRLNDINLKVNYFLPLFVIVTYLFMKVNGNFTIFGYELNSENTPIIVSILGVIIYIKDIVFSAKEIAKKIMGLKI